MRSDYYRSPERTNGHKYERRVQYTLSAAKLIRCAVLCLVFCITNNNRGHYEYFTESEK